MSTQKKVGRGFMTLKVELLSTGIMRTIVVPDYMTLVDLSKAIRAVMGWDGYHLWDFHARGRDGVYYEIPSREEYPSFASRLTLDATQVKLKKAFPARGTKLVYEYDFGDGWEHLVTRMADSKTQEIACVKSVGPDGIEDFGGPWRLADVLEGMRTRTPNGTSEDVRRWTGLSTGQDVQTYLKGETAEVKTQKLLEAIGCVTVDPPEEEPEVASSDEDKAHLLGSLFATTINMDVWEILEDALKNGGTCEFDDADCSLSEFFLTFFDGLKVKAGRSTPFFTNPSKLTVPKEWVTWYGQYAKDWNLQRGPFDILESYANSAVHLYGVISTDDFHSLVLRYDPGLQLSKDEVVRQLEARLVCPIGSYSIEDDLLVDARIASSERGDPDKMIRSLQKSHREFPRWYPATRDELFKWDVLRSPARTAEVERLEFVLLTLCKCPESQLQEVVDTIFDLMSAGAPPDSVYDAMVASGICERMSTNVRQPLLVALNDWAAIIRVACLNGHSAREILAEQAARAATPKIGRNAPCPCGSGKKYKLCCGKMA